MSSQTSPFAKFLLAAGALSLAAVTGCGVFGKSWDVKLEVVGEGSGNVRYAFSGDNDGKSETGRKLPWSRTQNVGFGFNDVAVTDAEPGTVCRIYVDGKLKEEQRKPDAKGTVFCSVNLQD
ncbi:MmpS family transport accessory protein [Streptomyces acidicola]|uniref:MmpS family transport accessory protein n=1 Tax=Streptomyces acidicola TaxID=2596892 RepID=UPI0037FDC63F